MRKELKTTDYYNRLQHTRIRGKRSLGGSPMRWHKKGKSPSSQIVVGITMISGGTVKMGAFEIATPS